MQSKEELEKRLVKIDGRGYKAYREIKDTYRFDTFVLDINHVQGDPFASPSSMKVSVPYDVAGFPASLFGTTSRKTAFQDYLARTFHNAIQKVCALQRGTGTSGLIAIDHGRQEVLERNSVIVSSDGIEIKFFLGLPAAGRTVQATQAAAMFFNELPRIVEQAVRYDNIPAAEIKRHVEVVEDQDSMRKNLEANGLVAFVANDALLPRKSGIDDRPLSENESVRFISPPSLEAECSAPNRGSIKGMGIPRGITLIVGGGFHGKTTLLNAIEMGVYNHIPGDGREYVVTVPDTVKVRAEDGRSIATVDISPFIEDIPFNRDTSQFTTDNASGSTSQAANIMEMVEVGATVLLMDEDTCATNFMIRDYKMQQLVSKDKEPITPLIDRARQLFEQHGISTLLAIGGSGEYFDICDTAIMMDTYRPADMTRKARELAATCNSVRRKEGKAAFGDIRSRIPLQETIQTRRGAREVKIDTKSRYVFSLGKTEVDLSAIEQLADLSQTRAIGEAIYYSKVNYMDGVRTLRDILDMVIADIDKHGIDILSRLSLGNLARPRKYEIAAAINRIRGIRLHQKRA